MVDVCESRYSLLNDHKLRRHMHHSLKYVGISDRASWLSSNSIRSISRLFLLISIPESMHRSAALVLALLSMAMAAPNIGSFNLVSDRMISSGADATFALPCIVTSYNNYPLTECASECLAFPNCQGFVHSDVDAAQGNCRHISACSTSVLVASGSTQVDATKTWMTYDKQIIVTADQIGNNVAGYTLSPGINDIINYPPVLYANTLGPIMTTQQCADQCTNTATCQSFRYAPTGYKPTCVLFSGMIGNYPNTGGPWFLYQQSAAAAKAGTTAAAPAADKAPAVSATGSAAGTPAAATGGNAGAAPEATTTTGNVASGNASAPAGTVKLNPGNLNDDPALTKPAKLAPVTNATTGAISWNSPPTTSAPGTKTQAASHIQVLLAILAGSIAILAVYLA